MWIETLETSASIEILTLMHPPQGTSKSTGARLLSKVAPNHRSDFGSMGSRFLKTMLSAPRGCVKLTNIFVAFPALDYIARSLTLPVCV